MLKFKRHLWRLCTMIFAVGFCVFMSNAVCVADDWDFDYGDYDYSADGFYDTGTDPFMDYSDENINVENPAAADILTKRTMQLNDDAVFMNIADLDIAGVWLGMTYDQVRLLVGRTGSLYIPKRDNSTIYSVPKDWRYSLDYECRQQGIHAPTELDRCINSLAKSRGILYASQMHLVRESTGETIDVYFTSNATNNRVWRVIYKNDVNELEGDAEKFEDQRRKKIMAFWQGVTDKYGAPNSGTDAWISSDNSFDPMMTAMYGQLELIDAGLGAMDTAENARASQEQFRAKPYAF